MAKDATRKFINDLGGPTKVAGLLSAMTKDSVKRPRVSMWGTLDTVPHKWRPILASVALKLKLHKNRVPAEVRGFMPSSRKAA